MGQKSWGAEIRAPLFTSSQASWDGLKEDSRLARNFPAVPQSRLRAARRWRERGASRGHRAWSAFQERACGITPGQAGGFPYPFSFLFASRARDEGPRWPLACVAWPGRPALAPLGFSGRVPHFSSLFSPSHVCTGRLIAAPFFLSSLVLSSVFCMITFLPDWNSFLKNTECKGAPFK